MDGSGQEAVGKLAAGSVFHDRYQVVRPISAGGMGAVYEVIQLDTRRRRALKTMLPSLVADPELRARFKLEATITGDVRSDHLVDVIDAGVDERTSTPFIVMELLEGDDLGGILRDRGRLPASEVATLLFQAALALDRTHAANIVHRDLKPENLFVSHSDDGTPRLKILDFGIAKVVAESTLARTTRALGTPLYMAPEQISGDGTIGPAADLYTLAHIAYALLTGRAFHDDEAEAGKGVYPLLLKIMAPRVGGSACARAASRGVELPAAFDAWFQLGTAVEPSDRFGSAGELVEELAAALGVMLPASGGCSPRERVPAARASARSGVTAAELPRSDVPAEPAAAAAYAPVDTVGAVLHHAPTRPKWRTSRTIARAALGVGVAVVGVALLMFAKGWQDSAVLVASGVGAPESVTSASPESATSASAHAIGTQQTFAAAEGVRGAASSPTAKAAGAATTKAAGAATTKAAGAATAKAAGAATAKAVPSAAAKLPTTDDVLQIR
ncbi:MAG: serine/threonine protein kinase [Myxococcales bacterium]|nr:serine/threonine protein kinase [Myxococcales bacterium]